MKKILILSAFTLFSAHLFSQPCEGTALLKESFDNGIPGNWTVLDLDGNTLFWSLAGRGYTGAFQSFTHHGQKCVANASWFSTSPGTANDWLITPAVLLGTAPLCFSWQASSMYAWSNIYEVRISTTTPTVSAFMANAPLFTQSLGELQGWNQYSVDLSAYAGQTIYIGFFYNATDQFPIYFDDIRITKPVARDASVKSLSITEVVPIGSHPLSGKLLNGGTSAITSMDLNWKVNTGPVNTVSFPSLNILPNAYYNYTHSTNWNPPANGTYTLKIWASTINGQPDMNTANDTLTQIVFVHNKPRKALIEEFTNTDCPPCATQNPAFDALLEPNRATGKVSMIKYHPMWPGQNDPMYLYDTLDIADRLFYYGTPGLPNASMNGELVPNCTSYYWGAPGCLTQNMIDSAYAIPSIFDLQVSNIIFGNTMYIDVTVTALTDIPMTSLKLRTAAIEDTLIYATPPGTNGETDFYQTMRRMLPNANGVSLGAMTANQVLTYNFSWVIDTPASIPQMRTVAFIQDDNNLKIYQSEITGSVAVGIVETSTSDILNVFPNPSSGVFTIEAEQTVIKNIEIYNVLGEMVLNLPINEPTNQPINLSSHPDGIYFVRVNTEKGIVSKKIIISR